MQLEHPASEMEDWDGVVLDINGTSKDLGIKKCRKLLGMQVISGSDTTSFLYGKGKVTAINKTLLSGDFASLAIGLGEESVTHTKLMETGHSFFTSL